MTRPDAGNLDRAVLAVLQADTALAALMPGGVWWGRAAAGLTRFVLVDLEDGGAVGLFGQRGSDERLYRARAVGLSRDCTLGDMRAAGHRIDLLLDGDTPLDPPEDYAAIDCVLEEPITVEAADEGDRSLTWYQNGGKYRVTAAWPDPDLTLATGGSDHVD